MNQHITNGSIFDDLGFDEVEAENLKIRAMLMRAIDKYIQDNKLTQITAAKVLGVSQPRISDLIRGQIDKFTIDMLVNMLAKAHVSVTVVIDDRIAA
ncbi:helix-turn-helix domain-containing protein [Legionella dresdenensis]|uniref:Helix-turn-helix domain-containing protein n=1 Tax=Legionella dresdenensis TaxID=450200 RepID=A0ABV8CHF3_9GAMM